MVRSSCNTLIVGGGIIGLSLARELVLRGLDDIVILEKEARLGEHASGRNSGVLHAGIYYTPDTLKARFCAEGNSMMKSFCKEKGLTLIESGKVIVAKTPEEVAGLHELKRRADASQVFCQMIGEHELATIEPHAKTCGEALYSPNTAVLKPTEVLIALQEELETSGRVHIQFETQFIGLEGASTARTSNGRIEFRSLVNAAGMYADKVAHLFGLGEDYRILPFKGTYKQVHSTRNRLVRGNIYPVPDLRNPFLGVHFTRTGDDRIYVGPTAIPAFGRENYGLLERLGLETFQILYRDAVLLFGNPGFRNAAMTEPKMMIRRIVFEEAKHLVPDLQLADIAHSNKVGIRAQLVHWPTKQLVTDFVVLRKENSLHILNAISPAFTSSLSFSRAVVQAFLDHDGALSNAFRL